MSSPARPTSRPSAAVDQRAERVARSAYPTGNALRRALLTLRVEGPKSFWFKLLGEFGYRRLLLVERMLDQPVAAYTPRLPVDISMLEEREIDGYLAFRSGASRLDIAGRLRSGEMCFVARYQGKIVSGVWVAAQPVRVPFLGCQIDLAPGDAHIYDKFTAPAYRGYGIANAVRTFHLRHLQRAGFRRATGTVLPENASSLRDDFRGGFRVYGMLGRVKVGRWQRVFLMPPPRDRG